MTRKSPRRTPRKNEVAPRAQPRKVREKKVVLMQKRLLPNVGRKDLLHRKIAHAKGRGNDLLLVEGRANDLDLEEGLLLAEEAAIEAETDVGVHPADADTVAGAEPDLARNILAIDVD